MDKKQAGSLAIATIMILSMFSFAFADEVMDSGQVPKISGSGYSGNQLSGTGFDVGGVGSGSIIPTGRLAPQHALLTQFTLKNVDTGVYVGSNAKIYVSDLDVMKACYSTCVTTLDPASHYDTSGNLGTIASGLSWLVSKTWSLGACGITALADQSKSACSSYDNKFIDTKIAYDIVSGTTHNPPKISQDALDTSSWSGTAWFNAIQIPIGKAIAPGSEANYYWWVIAKTQSKLTPIQNTDWCNTHSLDGAMNSEQDMKDYADNCPGDHTYAVTVGYNPDNIFYSATITYRVTPPQVEGIITFLQLAFLGAMVLAGYVASGGTKA